MTKAAFLRRAPGSADRSLAPLWRRALAVALVAAGFGTAQAGSFTSNLDADPGGLGTVNHADFMNLFEDGYLKLIDLADLEDENGVVVPNRLPLQASYVFPDIDGGAKVGAFTANFKVRVGGGTENAAQGFSFVLAHDFPENGTFREGGGATTGLTISFDLADGLAPLPGAAGTSEGNAPGDAPGVIVKQGGRKVVAKKFAGLRTDGPGKGHAPVFVPVQVKLDADGTLDVTYNGQAIYTNEAIGYIPVAGQFGVGAGTEEITVNSRDNFWFDDINITTTVATGAVISSVSPGTTDAPPDASVVIGIESLGAGAVTMQFDGSPVTPTKSVDGDITTLTFKPATLLAPGSKHTVALTYAGKSFSYGFAVANAPLLGATAAVTDSTVNKTTTGFSLKVHQIENGVADTTAARVERQLNGDLGPNIADLTAADASGIFIVDTINFDESGTERGSIPGDYQTPGIPGTLGTTDNIAAEVTAVLDLKAGAYTIGGVFDDSLRLTVGEDPRDITSLRLVDANGPGAASGAFIVQQAGLYPLRALWSEAGGASHLELWVQDAAGNRTALNDSAGTTYIKTYAKRANAFQSGPYLSSANPAPNDVNISTSPKITFAITDGAVAVKADSITVALDGQPLTVPAGAAVKAGKVTTVSFQGPALEPTKTYKLKVGFTDASNRASTREFAFTTGKSAGGNALNTVKGYWTFDKGNLGASVGRDLAYLDSGLAGRYKFGTTGQGDFAGVPDINGKHAKVLYVPYTPNDDADATGPVHKRLGLKALHNIAANGGGKKVNQYTIVMDLLFGETGFGFQSLYQLHDLQAPGDGDMFWRRSSGTYGKSCCSTYDGLADTTKNHPVNTWKRIVISVDLSANPPVLAKYIDGFKHTDKIGGTRGKVDSEFALNTPDINFFADEDNERQDTYVNAIQIREGRISDEEAAALGGADANGIPMPWSSWEFDDPANPLAADVGQDLQYLDPSLAGRYKSGITGQGDFAAIPNIGGKPARVLYVPYTPNDDADATGPVHKRLGFKALHSLVPNGGGAKVNQYTIIMDLLFGETGFGFQSLYQLHDLQNPGDGDMFWRRSSGTYGKSCCSTYDGLADTTKNHPVNTWRRVVFSVDLSANPPVLAKYIDGYKHTDKIGGTRGKVDSEFALNVPDINFFADEDNERHDTYVAGIQIRNGRMTDEEVAALGAASAAGIPTPDPVKAEWNFNNAQKPLAATVGADLAYVDASLAGRYRTGTTGAGDLASIPAINGKPAGIMYIPYTPNDDVDATGPVHRRLGFKALHGILANGGGARVNQYTIIMDLLFGETGFGFQSLYQLHDLQAPGDGDMFWRRSSGTYGKSCCSTYDGLADTTKNHPVNTWRRVVFSVDLSATPPVLAKYIDGFKHTDKIGGTRGKVDSEFALNIPDINLFTDEDNERHDTYVNAIQIREGRISDEEAAALGGADAAGIPAAPSTVRIAAVTPIATELHSSTTVGGTYALEAATVNSTAKTITLPLPAATKYFRVRGATSVTVKSIVVQGGNLVISYQ